ncbi:MAG: TSUP family transporter [Flaviflexus sp.]|nr:TSUP family transporter [Flaviflexus sp.]
MPLEPSTIVLILAAALLAGWVDSIAGGGGLIQLPALLLFSGLPPIQVIATNKVPAFLGTSVSTLTYYRRVGPDMRTALPMAACALAGSVGGAALASLIPSEAFEPIIVVACAAVAIWTVVRRDVGLVTVLRHGGRKHNVLAAIIGTVIGVYDGVLGPGTGSFLIIGLVGVLGYAFMPASAIAKVVNLGTNIGALVFFIPAGHVNWGIALPMAVANMLGNYVGSRMAVSRGSGFVRLVFLIVVTALILRLGYNLITR